MAREKNRMEEAAESMSREEWDELSRQLWKDFRLNSTYESYDARQTRAKTAMAIAAIQPFKPK